MLLLLHLYPTGTASRRLLVGSSGLGSGLAGVGYWAGSWAVVGRYLLLPHSLVKVALPPAWVWAPPSKTSSPCPALPAAASFHPSSCPDVLFGATIAAASFVLFHRRPVPHLFLSPSLPTATMDDSDDRLSQGPPQGKHAARPESLCRRSRLRDYCQPSPRRCGAMSHEQTPARVIPG